MNSHIFATSIANVCCPYVLTRARCYNSVTWCFWSEGNDVRQVFACCSRFPLHHSEYPVKWAIKSLGREMRSNLSNKDHSAFWTMGVRRWLFVCPSVWVDGPPRCSAISSLAQWAGPLTMLVASSPTGCQMCVYFTPESCLNLSWEKFCGDIWRKIKAVRCGWLPAALWIPLGIRPPNHVQLLRSISKCRILRQREYKSPRNAPLPGAMAYEPCHLPLCPPR